MPVSEGVVNQIKERIEISSLIEEYLPLKKAGKNYVAKCPFHKDDTPSFYVSPDLNIFHCFGCGKSGDIITFVMEFEKVPFPEALRILARKAGIEIGRYKAENDVLYSIHDFAADFYNKELLKSEKVLDYLKRRGFEKDSIEEFQLGFAPHSSNFIAKAKKEFKIEDLIKSGLVKKHNGRIKDTFFIRLLFPLFSSSGKIIGFGGRRLSKKGPKYLNSPDTPIHKKGKNLYSLWHAKEEIRKAEKVILVEGYFDFLSLYKAGIKNAVACLGTSLTTDQTELISRYAKEVILFFDEDTAGKIATLRSLGMLLEEGIDVKIRQGGQGKDPDEIISKQGIEAFKEIIAKSNDFMDWMMERIQKKYKLSSPTGLSKAIEEISAVLESIKDNTKREVYKDFIAKKLVIRKELLDQAKTQNYNTIINQKTKITEREESELSLIYAMLENPKEKDAVFSIVKEDYFKNAHLKKYFRLFKEGTNLKTKDIIDSLPASFVNYLIKKSEEPQNSAIDWAKSLKRYHLNKLIEKKLIELQKIDANKEENYILLCKEIDELKEEREYLKKGEFLGK